MTDILQGLISGAAPLLLSWVFPSAIALAFFDLTVLPSIAGLPVASALARMDASNKVLFLAFGAIALGLVLNAIFTPLYRFLEGYSWPGPLQRWGVDRQRTRMKDLERRADNAPEGWQKALLLEKFHRYPVEDEQIAPTRLGNALRSFETYGVNRYNLDSQSFWVHLLALVPQGLRDDVTKSRTAVDFFVCLVYLSVLLGAAALCAGLLAPDSTNWKSVTTGIGAFVLIPGWYRGALIGTSYWGATVRALVDLGRKPLADALGLRLPASIEEERTLWSLVAAFAFYEYDPKWSPRLDPFRSNLASKLPSPPQKPAASLTRLRTRMRRFLRGGDGT